MNKHSQNPWQRIAALLPMLAFVVPAFGQATAQTAPATEETVQLPEFTVNSSAADRYGASDVMSVARVSGSILDAPLTVNVIPKELMGDVGANTEFDVAKYFAGVSAGRGASVGGIMDRQNFRGFEVYAKTVDNFSTFELPGNQGFQANFDPAFIERSELVMGPDSILSPTGSPGGSVNIITKSPQFKPDTSITLEAGIYSAQKVVLDSTGPVSDKLAYRVVADYQDTQTFEPGRVKQTNGEVALSYQFTPSSKLTFKWIGEDWAVYGAMANPNNNGEVVENPFVPIIGGTTLPTTALPGYRYDGYNGSTRWSQRYDRVNIGSLEYTGALTDKVALRLGVQGFYDEFVQDVGYPNIGTGTEIFDNAGNVIGFTGTVNPASQPELAQIVHSVNYSEQLQADVAGNFHPGVVSFSPVAGFAYQQNSQPYGVNYQDKNAATMPNTNLFATDNYSPPHPQFYSDYSSSFAENIQHNWLTQTYAYLKTGFYNDRLQITGGASRTWADPQLYQDNTVGTRIKGLGQAAVYEPAPGVSSAAANQVAYWSFSDTGANAAAHQPTQSQHKDAYLAGVVAKVTDTTSLYASFSTNDLLAGGTPVLWSLGKQYEFGVKNQLFDNRILISADHFQISQTNVSTVNPLHNVDATQPGTLQSNLVNHGFELNVAGGLTKNLSVIASVTTMKLRTAAGQKFKDDPDSLANLLLNYHFTEGMFKGASVFVGAQHEGKVPGEASGGGNLGGALGQPGFYLAAYTIINAGGAYSWDRYSVNVNVDNVANTKYWWEAASRQSVNPGPGIDFRVSFTAHIY